jgi:hypothetical protein
MAMAENLGVFTGVWKESQYDTKGRKVNFCFKSAGFNNCLRIAREPTAAQVDLGESERFVRRRAEGGASDQHARI